MYKNILAALDIEDQENSKSALKQALFLAKTSGATLHLLYVRHHLPHSYSELLSTDFDADERQESLDALARFRTGLDLDPDRITISTERGPVSYVVLEHADKWDADLIVIGSHTPSVTSKLFGSNASSIVHKSKVGVLIVRAGEKSDTVLNIDSSGH